MGERMSAEDQLKRCIEELRRLIKELDRLAYAVYRLDRFGLSWDYLTAARRSAQWALFTLDGSGESEYIQEKRWGV